MKRLLFISIAVTALLVLAVGGWAAQGLQRKDLP